jgi:hypothetical protein
MAKRLDTNGAKAEIVLRQAGEILHLTNTPTDSFYGPIVEAWDDSSDHSKGSHYARQFTPEARQWNILIPNLTEVGAWLSFDSQGPTAYLRKHRGQGRNRFETTRQFRC